MTTKDYIFSDRLVGLAVHNGLVRIDLATFAGMATGADDKPAVKLEATHQLVMPVDAFVTSVEMQVKLVNELRVREQRRGAEPSPIA